MIKLDCHSGLSLRLSSSWEPKPLQDLGVVAPTYDSSVAPMATIWSNASWCMNDCGEPVSRRARQQNADVAEAPLVSDGNA